MEETLNLVFDEISFELGVGGEKHELILTPEGDKVKLFELVYFQKHAPKEISSKTKFRVSSIWATISAPRDVYKRQSQGFFTGILARMSGYVIPVSSLSLIHI